MMLTPGNDQRFNQARFERRADLNCPIFTLRVYLINWVYQFDGYPPANSFRPGRTENHRGNKTTNITVIFPKILGKDKAQQFTLEFTTSDFFPAPGNVWEISIPKLAKSESPPLYRLSLAVPDAFGQAATPTPAPSSRSPAPAKPLPFQ
jgi:hypothetical protein